MFNRDSNFENILEEIHRMSSFSQSQISNNNEIFTMQICSENQPSLFTFNDLDLNFSLSEPFKLSNQSPDYSLTQNKKSDGMFFNQSKPGLFDNNTARSSNTTSFSLKNSEETINNSSLQNSKIHKLLDSRDFKSIYQILENYSEFYISKLAILKLDLFKAAGQENPSQNELVEKLYQIIGIYQKIGSDFTKKEKNLIKVLQAQMILKSKYYLDYREKKYSQCLINIFKHELSVAFAKDESKILSNEFQSTNPNIEKLIKIIVNIEEELLYDFLYFCTYKGNTDEFDEFMLKSTLLNDSIDLNHKIEVINDAQEAELMEEESNRNLRNYNYKETSPFSMASTNKNDNAINSIKFESSSPFVIVKIPSKQNKSCQNINKGKASSFSSSQLNIKKEMTSNNLLFKNNNDEHDTQSSYFSLTKNLNAINLNNTRSNRNTYTTDKLDIISTSDNKSQILNNNSRSSSLSFKDYNKQPNILKKSKNFKLSILTNFKFRIAKRENIDKRVLRKFKKYLVKTQRNFTKSSFIETEFLKKFIKNEYFPPFAIDDGTKFKSFSTSYMIWLLSHKDILNLFKDFISIEAVNLAECLVRVYCITDKQEIELIQKYVPLIPNIYTDYQLTEEFENNVSIGGIGKESIVTVDDSSISV